MKITAHNPEVDYLEKAYLADSADASDTSLVLTNNNKFANTDKILIGRMGQERSEIQAINGAISGNTNISTSALDFPHDVDDPVYKLEYDQIKFYRASSIDGTYSNIATVDVDVDNEDKSTTYDDTGGSSTSYYKITFYNSVSTAESELSGPIAATGYSSLTAGKVIDRVVRRVRDQNYTVLSVDEYLDIMNEVNKDLITQARRPWRFLKRNIPLSTTAGQNFADLAAITQLWKINYITYDFFTGSQTRTWSFKKTNGRNNSILSHEEWINKYENQSWTDSDDIIDIAINEEDNYLMLGPAPRTSRSNVITVHYWKSFTEITGLDSVIETPNDLIYFYKMRAEYYSAKSETEKSYLTLATKYDQMYGAEVVKMQRVNRLDAGSQEQFKGPQGYARRYRL